MPRRRPRVTLDRAAEILGVAPKTARRYAAEGTANGTGPAFPPLDEAGTVDRADLLAWQAARPGRGKPRGARAQGSPCQKCGLMVERRWKEQRTGRELLLCKPDWVHVEDDLPEADLEAWLADLAVPPK